MNKDIFTFENQPFTVVELYQKLGFSTVPSDRELEAKIIMFIRKYNGLDGSTNDRLYRFFTQVYDFFFLEDDNESLKIIKDQKGKEESEGKEDEEEEEDEEEDEEDEEEDEEKGEKIMEGLENPKKKSNSGTTAAAAASKNKKKPFRKSVEKGSISVNPVAYKADNLNPISKQTIQRIIVIDSNYRNLNATNSRLYPHSTSFNIELSEPLRDVLSLKLYSYSIPYNWYTINTDFGSNFFILKGTSPGLIDLGAYDFKVEIEPGNYNSTTLKNAVTASMISLKENDFTEVNFIQMICDYNEINTRSKFLFDFQNIYQEYSYQLNWPNTDIASYLKFDYLTYNLHTIYSFSNFQPKNSEADRIEAGQYLYTLDALNNYFEIIQYSNPMIQVTESGQTYYKIPEYSEDVNEVGQPIKVSLSLPFTILSADGITNISIKYSRIQIFENLRSQLQGLSCLDPFYNDSFLQQVNTVDSSTSYYKMFLPLNRKVIKTKQNSKYVVRFPQENNIWTGETSCLKFKFYSSAVKGKYVELDNIYSENSLNSSTYNISRNPILKLSCQLEFYISNIVELSIATNPFYTLKGYLSSINRAFEVYNNDSNNSTGRIGRFNQGTKLDLDSNSNSISIPNLSLDYTMIFNKYKIQFKDNRFQINSVNYSYYLQGDQINDDVLSGNTITLKNIPSNSEFFIDKDAEIFRATISDSNYSTEIYIVKFINYKGTSTTNQSIEYIKYSSFDFFYADFQDSIKLFKDNAGKYPFATSVFKKITVAQKYNIEFTLNVNKILTQHDFKLELYDSLNSNEENSWKNYLKFKPTGTITGPAEYNLSSTEYRGNPSIIRANEIIDNSAVFSLNNVNNFFSFNPLDKSTGLYTNIAHPTYSDQKYNDVRVTLAVDGDLQDCNNQVLFNKINASCSNTFDPIARGTFVDSVLVDNKQYCRIRVNLNKIYTQEDYVLKFFDVDSFVKCYVGANSVRSTKWDTTLGWILGFREFQSYALFQYVNVTTKVATLISDTSVTPNLYNYLLISMDDFNQNRLNDGIVTIAKTDSQIPLPSYASVANFFCGSQFRNSDNITDNDNTEILQSNGSTLLGQNNLTVNQTYAINEILKSQKQIDKIYSSGPFLKDVFAAIPLKIPNNPGDMITDFGGSLQNQNRVYFGPVNIRRLKIELYTDQGNILDLNGSNWSFKILCEQLYQKQTL